MDLSQIPLLDHHCHPVSRSLQSIAANRFRLGFAETSDPAMAPFLATSVVYLRAVRDLAALLDCPAEEGDLLQYRAAQPADAYVARLLRAANLQRLLIDDGFAASGSYTIAEMGDLAGCPAQRIVRLETRMEALIASHPTLAQAEEAFRAELRAARTQGIVALKSIAAYRGGLHVGLPDVDEAAAAFRSLHQQAAQGAAIRLSDRRLLDYLLRIALEEAASQELPVQFHVAFGDDDTDLRLSGPLQLRPLLQNPAYRSLPFVLLHCYPYVREAGYLASIYPHVFIDLSLTIPLTAHGGAAAIAEALELAPFAKLLLATDAHTLPELYYLGALHGRQSLEQVLERLVHERLITAAQAEDGAERILWRNAATLYQLS